MKYATAMNKSASEVTDGNAERENACEVSILIYTPVRTTKKRKSELQDKKAK